MIDENGELVFSNGDFKLVDSSEQDAILIVNTNIGAWKQHPTCGVGIKKYLGSSGMEANLRREIITQLVADGFKNVKVNVIQNNEMFDYSISADRQ